MKNRSGLAGTLVLWLILALFFLYASLGCAHPFEPDVDIVEFEAPAWYADTWVALELCTGLDGTFHRVRWFRTTTARLIPFRGKNYRGLANVAWYRIIIAWPFVDSSSLVQHEIIHLLLGEPGHDPGHDGPEWACVKSEHDFSSRVAKTLQLGYDSP